MKIEKLRLKNFRTFGHLALENIPDLVVLVSPNGLGKSTVLEAIAGTHDLVAPYEGDRYQYEEAIIEDGKPPGRRTPIWPKHLSAPVRVDEESAEVELHVGANSDECRLLSTEDNLTVSATFKITHDRHVIDLKFDRVLPELFRYYQESNVGLLDYIRPYRFYARQNVGGPNALTHDAVRKTLGQFSKQLGDHSKFSQTKTFVSETQIEDWSKQHRTGDAIDSLAEFRDVFDFFFSPKKFVGLDRTRGRDPRVTVITPFGEVDVDDLSDGEKEILHVFIQLYRYRDRENVILWDTPELHLNAALESRLLHAIQRIAPRNQYFIATHSLEFINSVPLDNLFVIEPQNGGCTIVRPSETERSSRVQIYRELGAQVGLQLVSSVVAFCEGDDSSREKRCLDRLLAPHIPGVNFVAGKNCQTVLAVGSKANRLLADATRNGDFLAIVDRDYREMDEVEQEERRYAAGLFMWHVHEVENLFLDPKILLTTLRFLGKLGADDTPTAVEDELMGVVNMLKGWIVADWVAWEMERKHSRPRRRLGRESPNEDLRKYARALSDRNSSICTPGSVDAQLDEKSELFDRIVERREALQVLPGKQILRDYLGKHKMDTDHFLDTAIGIVDRDKIKIREMNRLEETLNSLRTRG